MSSLSLSLILAHSLGCLLVSFPSCLSGRTLPSTSSVQAIDMLVEHNICANLGSRLADSNHFRRTRLYNQYVEEVLRANLNKIVDIFSAYSGSKALYGDTSSRCCMLSLDEWMQVHWLAGLACRWRVVQY